MIKNFKYRFYCGLHRIAKKIISSKVRNHFRMVNVEPKYFKRNQYIKFEGPYVNDIKVNGIRINKR